jgi:Tfp pilus assembly protein PilF
VRQFEFVSWDDPLYITQNPNVLGGLTWHGISWAMTASNEFYWHPLTWLSHMLDVEFYSLNAGGHHLTSLFFHIISTILLFWLLRRMTGAVGRSAFVAALFAVHPLHVESVAWVAERKDVLSALFWMLTIWVYVEYVRKPGIGRYLVVFVLYGLGLMAKPMLVTLPMALLLLDVWPLSRLPPAAARSGDSSCFIMRPPWSAIWRLVREKLPLLALAIASSIATFLVQMRVGAVGGLATLPVSFRIANALMSYVGYIGKMLWPARLAAYYPYPRSPAGWPALAAASLALLGVTAGVMWVGRHRLYLPIGWLWYLGTLLPVIGLVQAGDQAMADRFTYIPLIGLFLIVAWGVPDILVGWQHQRCVLAAAAALVILACVITARMQVQYWENSLVLWSHALEVTVENHRAHAGLADALATEGRLSEASAEYSEAIRILPSVADWHKNFGVALMRQGKLSEAIAQDTLALRIDPQNAEAYNNLGAMLARQGRTNEAIVEYSEALKLKPDYAQAHQNLGLALVSEGNAAAGIRECLESLRLDPDEPEWDYNVAAIYKGEGDKARALQYLETALKLNPGFQLARHALEAIQ